MGAVVVYGLILLAVFIITGHLFVAIGLSLLAVIVGYATMYILQFLLIKIVTADSLLIMITATSIGIAVFANVLIGLLIFAALIGLVAMWRAF